MAALPVGVFVMCRRQFQEGQAVEFFEQRASGGTPTAHRPVIQFLPNRRLSYTRRL